MQYSQSSQRLAVSVAALLGRRELLCQHTQSVEVQSAGLLWAGAGQSCVLSWSPGWRLQWRRHSPVLVLMLRARYVCTVTRLVTVECGTTHQAPVPSVVHMWGDTATPPLSCLSLTEGNIQCRAVHNSESRDLSFSGFEFVLHINSWLFTFHLFICYMNTSNSNKVYISIQWSGDSVRVLEGGREGGRVSPSGGDLSCRTEIHCSSQ